MWCKGPIYPNLGRDKLNERRKKLFDIYPQTKMVIKSFRSGEQEAMFVVCLQ